MMQMPPPTAEHTKLKAIAGSFTSEETLEPGPWDPKGGKATGVAESRMDLDGFWLLTDYVQTREGQVSYRGHGAYTWDQENNQYLMFWFDSMGMIARTPAKGRWDGNRLVFHQESPMGQSRYTYEISEGKYRFQIDHSQDGKSWNKFMDGTYTRKK